MRRSACFASLVLAACSSASSPSSDASEVDLATPPPASGEPQTAAPREPRGVLDSFHLSDEPGARLGDACPPKDTDKPASAVERCGSRGLVSLETGAAAFVVGQVTPCKLRRIPQKQMGPNESSACVEGDHLLLRSVCVMCRMPDQGLTIHAKISELTAAQRAFIRQSTMLTQVPEDAAGWRALLSD